MSGPYNGDLYVILTTVLDGTGGGVIRYAPAGFPCQITNINVRCSSNMLEATSYTYAGYVGGLVKDSTRTGSSGDTSDVVIDLQDGSPIYITWSGGDVGSTATASISGTQPVRGGFRAV